MISQIHKNLNTLCDAADQSMTQAEKTGQISNALYVLREERELISQNDMADYVLNYPECQYLYDKEQTFNEENDIEQEPKFHQTHFHMSDST